MKKLSRIWKDKDIHLSTKIQLVKTLVVSITFYGAESWTLSLDTMRRLQAAEMWCSRRLLRISWTSHTSNKVVRQIGEAADTSLDGIIFGLKLRNFRHIVRRAESLEKEIMLAMTEGTRRQGRSKSR